MMARPAKVIVPRRSGRMPMIDLSVVVLPAPLRPSRVATSPAATAKSTPCRTCDSPYQASSPCTSSKASAAAALRMTGTEISLAHFGVVGDLAVRSFGQDAAPSQHRDDVREIGNHRQIVLDHEHGARLRNFAHQR